MLLSVKLVGEWFVRFSSELDSREKTRAIVWLMEPKISPNSPDLWTLPVDSHFCLRSFRYRKVPIVSFSYQSINAMRKREIPDFILLFSDFQGESGTRAAQEANRFRIDHHRWAVSKIWWARGQSVNVMWKRRSKKGERVWEIERVREEWPNGV